MDKQDNHARTIDEYIGSFPKDIQQILETIRAAIRETAPAATEAISYGMPTFKLNGNLIHFAAFKNHIGLYPEPSSATAAFRKELAPYRGAKASVRFPLNQPPPLDLIRKIVRLRLSETEHTPMQKKR